MPTLGRLGVLIVLMAVIVAAMATPSQAYSCAPITDPRDPKEFDRAVAIFSATVVEQSLQKGTATLDVLQVWKGELTQRITMPILRHPPFVTTIDWLFDVGHTYLIFGFGDSIATMRAEKCTRTTLLEDADEALEMLKAAGYRPRQPQMR